MISMGPDLCPRILYGPGPSVLFRGLDLGRGILHNLYRGRWLGLYRGSLHGLCGLGLRPCIFLGRPGLELLEQFFSDGPADLGLALSGLGLALAGLGLALIGRFNSRSFFAGRRVGCRRRQILSGGD